MKGDLTAIPWQRDGAIVRAVVETSQGSRYKYAFEPATRGLRLEFMLARGLSWPYDFGFVPQTLCADGDPADVLVMMEVPTVPLAMLKVRLLGGFDVTKDGLENDRLVACPVPMKGIAMRTDRFQNITDLPPEELAELEHFLREYSEEQGHDIVVRARYGVQDAERRIKMWHRAWKEMKA
jgi:inorganic pyrophosphatase